jgi:predicted DNA-binding transcriptional regulator AlpA
MTKKPDPTDPMRMLRVGEVARLLSCHPMSIWRWAREGTFPRPVRLTSRLTAWRASDVMRWVDERARGDG